MILTNHYLIYIHSADSLEEVVGLDIGYTGNNYRKHRNSLEDELGPKMDEYLQEYEHRRAEKTYFKRMTMNERKKGIPATSIHNDSLHGSSYHGRKIITSKMIESLDATSPSSNDVMGRSNGSSSSGGRGSSRKITAIEEDAPLSMEQSQEKAV